MDVSGRVSGVCRDVGTRYAASGALGDKARGRNDDTSRSDGCDHGGSVDVDASGVQGSALVAIGEGTSVDNCN